MEDDLKALEEKLTHLLSLFNGLQDQNAALKTELSEVKQESVKLKQNMAEATTRIETLMQKLP